MIAEEVDNMQDPKDVDLVIVHTLEDWSSCRGLIHQFLRGTELPDILWNKVWVQGERRNQYLGDLYCRRDFGWHTVCGLEDAAEEVRKLAAEINYLCEVGRHRHVVLIEIWLRICPS